MANVSVFNMEGKEVGTIELSDAVFGAPVNEHLVHMAVVQQLANNVRERRKPKRVPRFPAAAESPGDRREPVMQGRVQRERLSGRAAAWYSLPCRETIPSSSTGRKRGLRSNQLLQAGCRTIN